MLSEERVKRVYESNPVSASLSSALLLLSSRSFLKLCMLADVYVTGTSMHISERHPYYLSPIHRLNASLPPVSLKILNCARAYCSTVRVSSIPRRSSRACKCLQRPWSEVMTISRMRGVTSATCGDCEKATRRCQLGA